MNDLTKRHPLPWTARDANSGDEQEFWEIVDAKGVIVGFFDREIDAKAFIDLHTKMVGAYRALAVIPTTFNDVLEWLQTHSPAIQAAREFVERENKEKTDG